MASPLRSLPEIARRRAVRAAARALGAMRASRPFVFGVVALLALLGLMAAAPIRSLDATNQRVAYLEATKQQLTSSVSELEQRRARLRDRDEVELLARTQFGLVKPGETAYVVSTPEDPVEGEAEPPEGAGHRAWYRWLVDAVVDMLPS